MGDGRGTSDFEGVQRVKIPLKHDLGSSSLEIECKTEDKPPIDPLNDRDFVRLLATHNLAILHYIMMFLPQRVDAEEVLQRTAVVLWEKLREYDTQREFLPWALHRAYYEVLNFRKEAARSKLVFSEEVIALLASDRQEQQCYLQEMKEALDVCLEKVQPSDLQLLQCRYANTQSLAELASEFGKTAKSLYRRLDRVRAQLAECVRHRLELESLDAN